jgi:hypothetical protein
MPTLPFVSIRILSVLFVLKANELLSFVPSIPKAAYELPPCCQKLPANSEPSEEVDTTPLTVEERVPVEVAYDIELDEITLDVAVTPLIVVVRVLPEIL